MKVLIGVDGSPDSFAAVQFVGRILSAERDEVQFYYSPPRIGIRAARQPDPSIVERARVALADAVFNEARTYLPAPLGDTSSSVVGTRTPRDGLLITADETRADLVVVGSHGAGGWTAPAFGGVGRALAHSATIPVLVVRTATGDVAASGLRVLLACDGSTASKQAAALLSKFTWPEGSVGKVISVVESVFQGQVPPWLADRAREADTEAMAKAWVDEHEEEMRQIQNDLTNFCHQLPPMFQGHPPILVEGQPADRIIKAVGSEGSHLVVAGARGLGPVSRLLLGSTSDRLLGHVPCSVLIAREHPQP